MTEQSTAGYLYGWKGKGTIETSENIVLLWRAVSGPDSPLSAYDDFRTMRTLPASPARPRIISTSAGGQSANPSSAMSRSPLAIDSTP